MDLRRVAVLVATSALTALLVIALGLPAPGDHFVGTLLLRFGGHGIHLIDLPSAACWLAGMAACWSLWRR